MGNKIGDYIHWKYDNYLNRGIEYGSSENGKIVKKNAEGVANSVFQEQRRRIQKEIISKTNTSKKVNIKYELEKKLNFYYNAKTQGNISQLVGNTGITAEELKEKILDYFNKSQHGLAVGTDTLDIKLTALSQMFEKRRRGDLVINTYRTQLESIHHRMDAIWRFYSQLSKKKQTKEIAELMHNLDVLENMYFAFLKETEQITTESGRIDIQVKEYKTNLLGQQIYEGFITQLNLVYRTVKNIILKEALGELAEIFATTAVVVQQDNIEEEFEKLIEKIFLKPEDYGKVGNQTITPVLVSSNLAISGGSAKKSINGLDYFTHIGPSTSVKIHPVKGKVDLKVNIAGEDQYLSIKNYNMFDQEHDISILDGSSLIKYIQEYTIFTNHYLNIIVSHDPEGRVPSSNLIKTANQTLLLTMLLKALSGGIMSLSQNGIVKSDMANLFVVNNNKTGQWVVYFIEDLIDYLRNNLYNMLQFTTFKIDNIDFSENFTVEQNVVGDYLENKNSKEAYSRIYNLLKTLDSYELSISIKKNLLNFIRTKYVY